MYFWLLLQIYQRLKTGFVLQDHIWCWTLFIPCLDVRNISEKKKKKKIKNTHRNNNIMAN